MRMTVTQAVNWASIVSRARTAMVPSGLLAGAGIDLSEWYDRDCPGEMQVAADEAVHKLTEPNGGTLGGGVSAWISAALRVRALPLKLTAAQQRLVRGHPCSSCRHLR
jgi:hypothetical protein